MKIAHFLRQDLIIPRLRARDAAGVIRELGAFLARTHEGVNEEDIVLALSEREKCGSTALGEGIAVPHAKLDALADVIACLGRSPGGVDFGAPDGGPTHFFFVLIAPGSAHGVYLKVLARVSRLFKDRSFRSDLMSAAGAREICEILSAKDEG